MKLRLLIPILSLALATADGKKLGTLKAEGIDYDIDLNELLGALPDIGSLANPSATDGESGGDDQPETFEFFTEAENIKLSDIMEALAEAPDRTDFFNASLYLHNYIGTLHAKYHCNDCKPEPAASEAKSETSTDEILPGVPAFTNLDDLTAFLTGNPNASGAFALKLDKSSKPDFDKILRAIANAVK